MIKVADSKERVNGEKTTTFSELTIGKVWVSMDHLGDMRGHEARGTHHVQHFVVGLNIQ